MSKLGGCVTVIKNMQWKQFQAIFMEEKNSQSFEMKKLLPDSKVIVVLRDLVQRLQISFYKYKLSLGHIPSNLSFESYLDKCKSMPLDEKIKKRNYDYWGMEGGLYSNLLETWNLLLR